MAKREKRAAEPQSLSASAAEPIKDLRDWIDRVERMGELVRVKQRLADKNIALEVTKEAKEFIIDKGFNPDLGARPLRRALEQLIEDPLSEEILRGNFKGKNKIVVKVKDNALFFEGLAKEAKEEPAAAGAGGGTGGKA